MSVVHLALTCMSCRNVEEFTLLVVLNGEDTGFPKDPREQSESYGHIGAIVSNSVSLGSKDELTRCLLVGSPSERHVRA